MILESQTTIHKGIAFIFTPFTGVDKRTSLKFQAQLIERGLDFSRTQDAENVLAVTREKPTALEINVKLLQTPVGAPLGQVLMLGPHDAHDGQMFEREVEAVIEAFNDVWFDSNRQLLRCEVTVRDLFESEMDHAFQELWVHRLSQREDALAALGRPVLGGGLRLVMPPIPGDLSSCQIEVKIESFLQDTKKIFVETQFVWPNPISGPMDPSIRLKAVDDYVSDSVIPFIVGENHV